MSTALLLAQAGRQVAVLEARSVGAVTTGHSTAKATLLQATQLSKITSSHSSTSLVRTWKVIVKVSSGCRLTVKITGFTLSSATPTPTRLLKVAPLRYAVNSTLPADSVFLFR